MRNHPGAALFTRRAAGRAATPKVALGDTNFELAQDPVNPRRERMDDPQFQTDDARDREPHAVQAKAQMLPILQDVEKLKSRFDALKGSGDPEKEKALDDITSACDLITHHVLDITEDAGAPKKASRDEETVITLKVRPGTEKALLPLLENLQTLGQWGSSRSVVIDDFSDNPEKNGDGHHFFDGDGSDQIFDIKVQVAPKRDKKARLFIRQAEVKMHKTPPVGAPRLDQRTHLDQDLKDELNPKTDDPDLIRHTTGKSAAEKVPLLEALSALVHKQWTGWSQGIAEEEDLSDERMDRWEEECWMPYSQLSEEQKEKDRVEARQVIKLLERRGIDLKTPKAKEGRLFA